MAEVQEKGLDAQLLEQQGEEALEGKVPPSAGSQAVRRAAAAQDIPDPEEPRAKAPDIDPETAADATQWLLGSFHADRGGAKRHTLLVNVGTRTEPRKIRWTLQAISGEEIDAIREQSRPNRAQRRSAPSDMLNPSRDDRMRAETAQLRIIIAGSVDPDIRALTKDTGLAAAEEFLREALKFNWGLVDLIANQVLELSGYDDELIEDDVATEAAGN